ncbi:DUF4498-like protein [Aureococcus anophagefferens]|nr:DUF4498-like protein [Aureococcus anophagefferens]
MEDVQLPSLKTRDARECLARWGLAGLRVGRFRYEFQGDVDGRNAAAFVAGLLDTPGVRAWLNAEAPADAAVEATRLATTATSMALFDPLPDYALAPYLDLAKALYRDVATVYRRASDGEVAIATKAFAVAGPGLRERRAPHYAPPPRRAEEAQRDAAPQRRRRRRLVGPSRRRD